MRPGARPPVRWRAGRGTSGLAAGVASTRKVWLRHSGARRPARFAPSGANPRHDPFDPAAVPQPAG
ncbi:hypothetical protein DMP23_15920 [Amycolatopsis sp. A1MSW2902]